MGHWKKMSTGKTNPTEDMWFSRAIRLRDKHTCRGCGQYFEDGNGLECMHIYSRANKSVRWDPMNAIAGCRKCHEFFTREPAAWIEFCQIDLGSKHMDELRHRWQKKLKTNELLRREVSEHYRKQYNAMKKGGHNLLEPFDFKDYL